jgi:predicted lipoprotein with Yx(FWY)xxD motif
MAGTSSAPAASGGASANANGSAGTSGSAGATAAAGFGGTSASSGGSSSNGTSGAAGAAGSGGAAADTFTIHTTSKGNVVATSAGITLYVYQPDTPATGQNPALSACTNASGSTCLTHWPLYYGNPVVVAAGLSAADFGSFDRGGGVMQSTYQGWPLYRYDDDMLPGDIKGDGEKAGTKVVWYAVKLPFTAPPKP